MTESVTLEVVKSLLEIQANAFKASFKMMFDSLKEEVVAVKKDVIDLTNSLQFTQGQFDEQTKKLDKMEDKLTSSAHNIEALDISVNAIDNNLEYMENQSRRNNLKIMGVEENLAEEKSWDDTEKLVKELIKDKLGIDEDIDIERCHRVGNLDNKMSQPGMSTRNKEPRSIVAKISKWKIKEMILKKARNVKPEGIKFVADLSQRTLEKRRAKIPDLLQARSEGKVAYFVLDKLIVKNKTFSGASSNVSRDSEVSFDS